MSELFLTVLNMNITASYVILFVILIRLLLKKAPKFISYALWGVVAFRLLIPFSFESMFSLIPRNTNAVPIPQDIIYQQSPQINSGIGVVDSLVNNSLPSPTIGASVNPLQTYVEIGAYIWVLGIIALLVYSLISIFILKRQLKSAQLIDQNIFEAENLKTPFVLGLIKPKIYLPVGLNATERSYILLHEQTHIHRKDHIIKVLAFLTLSIHWFNPLVWIAFMLMSTDMELSCDEKVLKEMDDEIKKPYANSLLSLATRKHILNGSPLAFGEGNVRGRIKNVLNYKKPRFLIVTVSAIIVMVICFGLITNPVNKGVITEVSQSLSDRRPMVMANGMLYLDTGKHVPVEINDSAIIGEISSSVDQSEKPTKEGQTNFGSIGSKYAHYEENIVVLINNKWILFERDNNIYQLNFSEIDYTRIEKLQLNNINIIEEKIIDKDLSAFIFTNNENGEYKGAINSHGKSYYIAQVSMESTPEGLMGIEELQIFGKRAVKFYGILGANYAQAYYWLVEEKTEDSIFQVDGNTIEIDLDNDDKKEIVATIGTIPETRIYKLKEGEIYVSDINKSIGAKSVYLKDEGKKLFEVYFEPNKPEQYVFDKDFFIKK